MSHQRENIRKEAETTTKNVNRNSGVERSKTEVVNSPRAQQ